MFKLAVFTEGTIKIETLKDLEAHDNNWNSPKHVKIPKGSILTKNAKDSATRYGDLFWKLENGKSVSFSSNDVEVKHPYCYGYFNPDNIRLVEVTHNES